MSLATSIRQLSRFPGVWLFFCLVLLHSPIAPGLASPPSSDGNRPDNTTATVPNEERFRTAESVISPEVNPLGLPAKRPCQKTAPLLSAVIYDHVASDAANGLLFAIDCNNPHELQVTPSGVSATALYGQSLQQTQNVTLAVPNGGASSWTATVQLQTPGTWLSVGPLSGAFPATIAVVTNSTGLSPGTYVGTVQVNALGVTNAPYVLPISLSVTAPPDTTPPTVPIGLGATPVSVSWISLSWAPSTDNAGGTGVSGYRVERCQGASCTNFVQVLAPTTANYSNTGLAVNTTYRYRIRAADVAGNLSAYSTIISSTTLSDVSVPTAPSAVVTSVVASGEVLLSWTAATDAVGVIGYQVERCQNVGCTNFSAIALPAVPFYRDTGLSPSFTYRYRVRAFDAAGNLSPYGGFVSVIPEPIIQTLAGGGAGGDGIPATTSQVYDVRGSIGSAPDGALYFTQTDNSRVRRIGTDGMISNVPVSGLLYPLGITVGADGILYIANSSGQSVLQESPTGTTTRTITQNDGPVLSGVSDLEVMPDGTLFLSDNNNYRIRRLTPAGSLTTVAGTGVAGFAPSGGPVATTLPITPNAIAVRPDGSFYIAEPTVSHVQQVLVNGSLATLSLTGSLNGVAAGPDGSVFVSDNVGHKIIRQLPDGTTSTIAGNGVLGYAGDGGSPTIAQLRSPKSITVGFDGALYWVESTMVNGDYRIRKVQSPTVVVPSVSPTINPNTVAISWTTDIPLDSQVEYGLTASYGSMTPLAPALVTSHNVTVTGLTAGATYYFRVKSRDATGRFATSGQLSGVMLPDGQAPTAPSGLIATAISPTQVNLTWAQSTDNWVVTGYRVERCEGVGCTSFVQVGSPSGTSFGDAGLTSNTTYRYRVHAVDAIGNFSAYSTVVTVATVQPNPDTTAPTAPTGLTVTVVSASRINVNWTASTDNVGVTAYYLERCQGVGCTVFVRIGTPTGTTFNETGLEVNTSHSYRVRARDAANNLSSYSTTVSATTPNPTAGYGILAYGTSLYGQ